jgi:hypothetical protein
MGFLTDTPAERALRVAAQRAVMKTELIEKLRLLDGFMARDLCDEAQDIVDWIQQQAPQIWGSRDYIRECAQTLIGRGVLPRGLRVWPLRERTQDGDDMYVYRVMTEHHYAAYAMGVAQTWQARANGEDLD